MAVNYDAVVYSYESINCEEFSKRIKYIELVETISPDGYMDRKGSFRHYRLYVTLEDISEEFKSTVVIYSEDENILFESAISLGSLFYISENVDKAKMRFYFTDKNARVIRIFEDNIRSVVTRSVEY